MIDHKYIAVNSRIMLDRRIIFSPGSFVLLVFALIPVMVNVSNLDAASQMDGQPTESSQEVFASQEEEAMNIDLVVNTTTLEFQDLNNNSFPDVGETSQVLGTLYTPNTQNEIGTYRASFIWGNWANSTEGTPISFGNASI